MSSMYMESSKDLGNFLKETPEATPTANPGDELKQGGIFTPTVGSNYSDKMNELMSATINEWWEGLSKDDLLDYIAGQPTLTADVLRTIFNNSGSILAFDMRFDSATGKAVVDFHTR